MADSKKAHFSKSPILKIFSQICLALILPYKFELIFMGLKQKKSKWLTKKTLIFKIANSQKKFAKISQIGRMDESKFWCFFWFPENSLLYVILRYTVYVGNYADLLCLIAICLAHFFENTCNILLKIRKVKMLKT